MVLKRTFEVKCFHIYYWSFPVFTAPTHLIYTKLELFIHAHMSVWTVCWVCTLKNQKKKKELNTSRSQQASDRSWKGKCERFSTWSWFKGGQQAGVICSSVIWLIWLPSLVFLLRFVHSEVCVCVPVHGCENINSIWRWELSSKEKITCSEWNVFGRCLIGSDTNLFHKEENSKRDCRICFEFTVHLEKFSLFIIFLTNIYLCLFRASSSFIKINIDTIFLRNRMKFNSFCWALFFSVW